MGRRHPSEYSSFRGTKPCFSNTKVVNGARFSGREVLLNTSGWVGTFGAAHGTTLLLRCKKERLKVCEINVKRVQHRERLWVAEDICAYRVCMAWWK